MLEKEGVTYEYHHFGIVVDDEKPGEFYAKKFDLHTADVDGSRVGAQFHRFGPNHPFHPAIAKYPHIGFKVNDLDKACEGEEVIMDIYEPIPGYRCAMILDAGIPIEFVETKLSYEELVALAEAGHSKVRDMD